MSSTPATDATDPGLPDAEYVVGAWHRISVSGDALILWQRVESGWYTPYLGRVWTDEYVRSQGWTIGPRVTITDATTTADDGLAAATQRLDDILATDYRDEWEDREQLRRGYAEALARAARSDVRDLTRQAKADALDEAADEVLATRLDPSKNGPYAGHFEAWLRDRAAATREGRE